MLSDRDIWIAMNPATMMPPNRRHLAPLRIVPLGDDDPIQPASVDLRLGDEFIYWKVIADPETGKPIRVKRKVNALKFLWKPGAFVLATTLEYVEIPDWLCAKIDGKSTLGRQGITAHITAGLIDPGFKGMITLEMKNIGYESVTLHTGQSVCQLELHKLSSPAQRPYGHESRKSKYQFQVGVQEARGVA